MRSLQAALSPAPCDTHPTRAHLERGVVHALALFRSQRLEAVVPNLDILVAIHLQHVAPILRMCACGRAWYRRDKNRQLASKRCAEALCRSGMQANALRRGARLCISTCTTATATTTTNTECLHGALGPCLPRYESSGLHGLETPPFFHASWHAVRSPKPSAMSTGGLSKTTHAIHSWCAPRLVDGRAGPPHPLPLPPLLPTPFTDHLCCHHSHPPFVRHIITHLTSLTSSTQASQ